MRARRSGEPGRASLVGRAWSGEPGRASLVGRDWSGEPGRASLVGPGRASLVGPGRAWSGEPGRASLVGPGRASLVGRAWSGLVGRAWSGLVGRAWSGEPGRVATRGFERTPKNWPSRKPVVSLRLHWQSPSFLSPYTQKPRVRGKPPKTFSGTVGPYPRWRRSERS